MTSVQELLQTVALAIFTLLQGPSMQPTPFLKAGWLTVKNWVPHDKGVLFDATNEQIVGDCKTHNESWIRFPKVVQGLHEIYLDNTLIFSQGNIDKNIMDYAYTPPEISCKTISNGKVLRWTVLSPARVFAQIDFPPYIAPSKTISNSLGNTLFVVGFASVLLTAIFILVVFFGKISRFDLVTIVLYNALVSMYFLGAVPAAFGLSISPLAATKLSDFCGAMSMLLLFNYLHKHEKLNRIAMRVFQFATVIGLMIIFVAGDSDTEQLGPSTFLCGLFLVICNFFIIAVRSSLRENSISGWLRLTCFLLLVSMIANDMMVFSGVYAGPMLLPIGLVGVALNHALLINLDIQRTYTERDHLRENLEAEVVDKTSELRQKTTILEKTMKDLKEAQAELVNSAKLASLGTLSAGIAHEINNSLNFVNGALMPLERIVNQYETDENAKSKKLIKMMREGLELTFGIIKSLRNYTGLNQAKNKSVPVVTIVNDVINIIRNKIPEHVKVQTDGSSDLRITGNVVGLNQVLMNLITNGIDAIEQPGLITISWNEIDAEHIQIKVKDTGCGIPDDIKAHIFDPFFTTKDVGKGTGLGLHIVKKEVGNHGGTIEVTSTLNEGTEFKITLPAINAA